MKVKFNLKQRVVAFSLLTNTKEASLTDWKVINQAKMVLGLDDEAKAEYGWVENKETNMVQWDAKKAGEVKEYDIPKGAFDIMEKDLKKKNEEGKLNTDEADLALAVLEE